MGALINVFKSLFGGILSFFGGLVGGKKGSNGFFMEADAASMEDLPAASPVKAVAASVPAAKAEKGKKTKDAVKAVPATAPAKVARVMTPEELIVAAVQSKPVDATAAAVGTAGFATKYLVPTLTSGRRGPGPSLKMFKTMAKEIRG